MRLLVHLATKFMSYKLYRSEFYVIKKQIPGPYGVINLRVIRPKLEGRLPVILYFHGGGGMLANSKSYDRVIKNISCFSRAIVVAVDYHRAPEFKFPVPLEDCFAALMWVYKHAREIGGNGHKIAIAGDSAGGTLAASLSIYNRDKDGPQILKQVLINPRTDLTADTISLQLFSEGYGLSRKAIQFFTKQCLQTSLDAHNPYVSPLKANRLENLPSAYIITSEYDPLRDEGEAYALALHKAGNEVKLVRYLGTAHTMVVFGSTRETAQHAFQSIGSELKRSFT
jgi:acetyl esterase